MVEKIIPHHIAINLLVEEQNLSLVTQLMKEQSFLDIPILTLNLQTNNPDKLIGLFEEVSKSSFVHKKKIKVIVIGDWYDTSLVDEIKVLMESTSHYDTFFVALGVNYDGHEEILKATRLLARRVQEKRLNTQDITAESMKDNLISSYFVPPELIIETNNSYSGLLLWDAPQSTIYFHSITVKNAKIVLAKALVFYNELKRRS